MKKKRWTRKARDLIEAQVLLFPGVRPKEGESPRPKKKPRPPTRLRWKRQAPGYYEAVGSLMIDGENRTATFEIKRTETNPEYGSRSASWVWTADVHDSHIFLDAEDVHDTKRDAVASVENARAVGFRYSRWGYVVDIKYT